MLIELLRPCGAELSRRWLAALSQVPAKERKSLVAEVERRVVRAYGRRDDQADAKEILIISPPIQRDGYVEEIHTIYEVTQAEPDNEARNERRRDAGSA
jgi:hypothetical protein